jgi:hypothetical protein
MRTRIAATLGVACVLALPATASARIIDDGPARSAATPAPPRTVTVVRHTDDSAPLALASAALLVAMVSAGIAVIRRTPVPRVES